MVSFIGGITMFVVAIVVATRGIGLVIKCINVMFDDIKEGLNEKMRERKARRNTMNRRWE